MDAHLVIEPPQRHEDAVLLFRLLEGVDQCVLALPNGRLEPREWMLDEASMRTVTRVTSSTRCPPRQPRSPGDATAPRCPVRALEVAWLIVPGGVGARQESRESLNPRPNLKPN